MFSSAQPFPRTSGAPSKSAFTPVYTQVGESCRNSSHNSIQSVEEEPRESKAKPVSSMSFWRTLRNFSSGNMSLSSCGETAEDAFEHDYSLYDCADDDDGERIEMCCPEDERSSALHQLLCDKIEKQVVQLLARDRSKAGSAIVGLGNVLTEAIPRIMRLSDSEPYGVRGGRLIVKVNRCGAGSNNNKGGVVESLGPIALSSTTVSTFELTLTLNEERHPGISIKNWLRQLAGSQQCCYVISSEFQLEKRQLYRMSWSS